MEARPPPGGRSAPGQPSDGVALGPQWKFAKATESPSRGLPPASWETEQRPRWESDAQRGPPGDSMSWEKEFGADKLPPEVRAPPTRWRDTQPQPKPRWDAQDRWGEGGNAPARAPLEPYRPPADRWDAGAARGRGRPLDYDEWTPQERESWLIAEVPDGPLAKADGHLAGDRWGAHPADKWRPPVPSQTATGMDMAGLAGRGRGFTAGRGRGLKPPGAPTAASPGSVAAKWRQSALIDLDDGPGSNGAAPPRAPGGATAAAATSSSSSGHKVYSSRQMAKIYDKLLSQHNGKLPVPAAVDVEEHNDLLATGQPAAPSAADASLLHRPAAAAAGAGAGGDSWGGGSGAANGGPGGAAAQQQQQQWRGGPPPPGLAAMADKWLYRDPQGAVQGPFSSGDMLEWFDAGFFPPDLPVRAANAPSGMDWVPLNSVLKMWQQIGAGKGPPGFAPASSGGAAAAAAAAAPQAAPEQQPWQPQQQQGAAPLQQQGLLPPQPSPAARPSRAGVMPVQLVDSPWESQQQQQQAGGPQGPQALPPQLSAGPGGRDVVSLSQGIAPLPPSPWGLPGPGQGMPPQGLMQQQQQSSPADSALTAGSFSFPWQQGAASAAATPGFSSLGGTAGAPQGLGFAPAGATPGSITSMAGDVWGSKLLPPQPLPASLSASPLAAMFTGFQPQQAPGGQATPQLLVGGLQPRPPSGPLSVLLGGAGAAGTPVSQPGGLMGYDLRSAVEPPLQQQLPPQGTQGAQEEAAARLQQLFPRMGLQPQAAAPQPPPPQPPAQQPPAQAPQAQAEPEEAGGGKKRGKKDKKQATAGGGEEEERPAPQAAVAAMAPPQPPPQQQPPRPDAKLAPWAGMVPGAAGSKTLKMIQEEEARERALAEQRAQQMQMQAEAQAQAASSPGGGQAGSPGMMPPGANAAWAKIAAAHSAMQAAATTSPFAAGAAAPAAQSLSRVMEEEAMARAQQQARANSGGVGSGVAAAGSRSSSMGPEGTGPGPRPTTLAQVLEKQLGDAGGSAGKGAPAWAGAAAATRGAATSLRAVMSFEESAADLEGGGDDDDILFLSQLQATRPPPPPAAAAAVAGKSAKQAASPAAAAAYGDGGAEDLLWDYGGGSAAQPAGGKQGKGQQGKDAAAAGGKFTNAKKVPLSAILGGASGGGATLAALEPPATAATGGGVWGQKAGAAAAAAPAPQPSAAARPGGMTAAAMLSRNLPAAAPAAAAAKAPAAKAPAAKAATAAKPAAAAAAKPGGRAAGKDVDDAELAMAVAASLKDAGVGGSQAGSASGPSAGWSPEFASWCKARMAELSGDISLCEILFTLEVRSEVAELAAEALAGRPGVSTFVAEFLKLRDVELARQAKSRKSGKAKAGGGGGGSPAPGSSAKAAAPAGGAAGWVAAAAPAAAAAGNAGGKGTKKGVAAKKGEASGPGYSGAWSALADH